MLMKFLARSVRGAPTLAPGLQREAAPCARPTRRGRAERLRREMESVRGQPPLRLGTQSGNPEVDPLALPFELTTPESRGRSRQELLAVPLLPWLFLVNGSIDNSALEALATERGLEMVHVIDLDRFAEGSAGVLSPEVKWVGSSNCPGPIAAAAAVLTRLAVRIDQRREEKGGGAAALREAVVLCPAAEHPGFVAEVLALLLRNHWGVDPGRAEVGAVADALRALGSDAIQGAEPGTSQADAAAGDLRAFLAGCARRVTIVWPYEGASVEVVGDLVGGWHCRAPLHYNPWRRQWRLQLLGAAPGRHRYKFIVDGRWCADLRAPLEHDVWHNANNLLDVPPAPKGPALSAERQAALGAACLAFYTKPL